MAEPRPASVRVIDREHELKLFEAVLRGDGPSMITVQANEGFGKSWLLELFEERAMEMAAATARVVLEPDLPLISLCERIADGLARVGTPPQRFETLNQDRRTYNHEAFGLPRPPPLTAGVTISDSTIQGSQIIGAAVSEQLAWPAGHEMAARNAVCVGLLQDLHDLSRSRSVLLLLDQYERRTDDVQQWLERTLHTHVFNEADPFGQLIIVVASTGPAFPMLAKQLGTRSDNLVYAITSLSPWRDEHIVKWIEQHGISIPTAVQFIRELLDSGASLYDLRLLKQVILKEPA